jgi:hypothetical protein
MKFCDLLLCGKSGIYRQICSLGYLAVFDLSIANSLHDYILQLPTMYIQHDFAAASS